MTIIRSVTLEVPDPASAEAFYDAAFGLGDRLGLRASEASTAGFRGFTLSLVVSQPTTVDALVTAALDAGATPLKPPKKGFWGYGGVLRAPDGTIWKVATSCKKNAGPATREIDEIVLLLEVAAVAASKRFTLTTGSQWPRASPASTSSSTQARPSRPRSTVAALWQSAHEWVGTTGPLWGFACVQHEAVQRLVGELLGVPAGSRGEVGQQVEPSTTGSEVERSARPEAFAGCAARSSR